MRTVPRRSAGFWLVVCAGLAMVVAYQLFYSFPLAPTVTAAPPDAPMLQLAERPPLPRSPDDAAIDEIAARPLFAASRRPYVPPPAPEAEETPEAAEPALPLELAGTFLTDTDQAALLLVADGTPEWLREGQLIQGWRIERIEQDQVRLSKGFEEQVLRLREDIAVLKGEQRRSNRDHDLRELTGEPAEEDDATR